MGKNLHWTKEELEMTQQKISELSKTHGADLSNLISKDLMKKVIPKIEPKEKIRLEKILYQISPYPIKAEYVFHHIRKWRFDWAITELKIAIEYEGVFAKRSRHLSYKGYTGDCDKYNAANILGWKVLRYTAKNAMNVLSDMSEILYV